MTLTRRALLGATAAAGIAAASGTAAHAAPIAAAAPAASGIAHLPVLADGGQLALAAGLKAWRVGTIGVEPLLSDRGGAVIGTTPSACDGTGAFDFPQSIRLVRNHENRSTAEFPVPLVAGTVYDAGIPTGMGGNTVVELTRNGQFVQQWVALSGTIRNCAGGETPWGSWLACEEDTTRAGVSMKGKDGKTYTTQKDHGYVFEVFPDVVAQQIPEPIKAWGRAVWEGAAIDPSRTMAYITEDTGGGLFYRWTAPSGATIGRGIARQFGPNDGTLQAAKLVKNGTALVHYGQLGPSDLGKAYPVQWVNGGADRQAQTTDLRKQFPGATVHPKIEGCWPDANGLWFTLSYVSSSEATKYGLDGTDSGMIMYYDFSDQTLTLKEYYASGNAQGFDGPDNITVSPWGGVVIAEDGANPCSLIAFSDKRGSVEIVRDIADRGEFAGPCFTKSGSILFASIQGECTYAISGALGKHLG